jgi:hypothetical protein
MKTYEGLTKLITARNQLPPTGWIFVDTGIPRDDASKLTAMKFYVPENDDDEFYGEDNLATWLEVGTFKSVLELREKNLAQPTVAQYAEAAVHYRVYDDFLE